METQAKNPGKTITVDGVVLNKYAKKKLKV